MTTQRDLGLVWASSGGTLPVDQSKYESGWIAEIPTYQQFNYMVQGLDKNILHFAEESSFDWQDNINYAVGSKAKRNGTVYLCISASINNDPATDSTNSYWVSGESSGDISFLKETDGHRFDFGTKSSNSWVGQEQTVRGKTPMTAYFTDDNTKNWALGNYAGEMVLMDLGNSTDTIPDGRNINKTGPNTSRIFHEGHLPDVSDVTGGVEEAPSDTKLYARQGINSNSGQWIEVTTTTVSDEPPPPLRGAGQGWFNLENGQLYIDVDDGDSTQWVPSSSPYIPDLNDLNQAALDQKADVSYVDTTASGKADTNGTYSGLRAQATTKDDVGLGSVPNSVSDSTALNSGSSLASSKAVRDLGVQLTSDIDDAKGNEVATTLGIDLDYPIGSYVTAFTSSSTGDNFLKNVVIQIPSTNQHGIYYSSLYTPVTSLRGPAINGVWRYRGYVGAAWNAGTALFQRVS